MARYTGPKQKSPVSLVKPSTEKINHLKNGTILQGSTDKTVVVEKNLNTQYSWLKSKRRSTLTVF